MGLKANPAGWGKQGRPVNQGRRDLLDRPGKPANRERLDLPGQRDRMVGTAPMVSTAGTVNLVQLVHLVRRGLPVLKAQPVRTAGTGPRVPRALHRQRFRGLTRSYPT